MTEVDANLELLQTQARLARLLERDAKYLEAETLLRGIWDDPMPTGIRYEVGRLYARVLRLRDKWDELDSFLSARLQAVQEDGDTEELAQLLVLRMEADLCAYPEPASPHPSRSSAQSALASRESSTRSTEPSPPIWPSTARTATHSRRSTATSSRRTTSSPSSDEG